MMHKESFYNRIMSDNCISTDTGNKTLFETQNYEESKCPSGTLLKE